MKKPRKPRFIKPPNILKDKVGIGGIDEKLLVKSQQVIDKNETGIDFATYAEQFLKEFSVIVREARSNDNFAKTRNKMIGPVMQLKANGGMFQYQLVSEVADIALRFLEDVDEEEVNNETLDVLKAHENTLKVIITNKLKGNGGSEGDALIQELDKACKRYFSKYQKS